MLSLTSIAVPELDHRICPPAPPQVPVPSPYTDASLLPLVRRLQRHTLLSSSPEWVYMSTIFSRSAEQERLQGSAYSQVMQQQQPWRGGRAS